MRVVNGKLVKTAAATQEFGLVDLMFKLGDGAWADQNRLALMDQTLTWITQNMSKIAANTSRGKTTQAAGIKWGFDPADLQTCADYHIVIQDPRFITAIAEFKQALAAGTARVGCGYMATAGTKELAPFWAFVGTQTNIVITKGSLGGSLVHQMQFIPAEVTRSRDFDPADPAGSMADLAKTFE